MSSQEAMTIDDVLQRTVGRWNLCPLWVLRGRMFSSAEKALIIALIDLWHSTGRPDWFYASNTDLCRLAGLPKQTLVNVRRRLIQKCVLETQPGKHRLLATRYRISQEFLHLLAQNSTPLKTSTYSGGLNLDGSSGGIDPSKFRRINF